METARLSVTPSRSTIPWLSMLKTYPQNGLAVTLNEVAGLMSVVDQPLTTGTGRFVPVLAQGGELSEIQLIGLLLAAGVIVCVVAWYFGRIRRYVLWRWQKFLAGSRSPEFHTPALVDGATERTRFHWQPETLSSLAIESAVPESAVPESTVPEITLDPSEDFGESPADDVDTKYENLLAELAEAQLAGSRVRSEFQSAGPSLIADTTQQDSGPRLEGQGSVNAAGGVADLQKLADSLEQKLRGAEAELETECEQSTLLRSKVEAYETESLRLQEQASVAATLEKEVASLKQELGQRDLAVDDLKIASTKAQEDAALRAGLLEESEKHNLQLADQLARFERSEEQAHTELEDARESIESLTARLNQANQETGQKEKAAGLLRKEAAQLNSDLEKLDRQLSAAAGESKELEAVVQAMEVELKSEKSDHLKTKDELARTSQQVSELETERSSSRTEIENNNKRHAAAIEGLQTKLDDASELALKVASQQQVVREELRSKLAQSEAEVVSLKGETESLNSQVAALTVNAAETDSIKAELLCKTEELEVLIALRNEQDSEFGQLTTRVAAFEQQTENAQRELAETMDLLNKERLLSAQLKQEVKERLQDQAELGDKIAKQSELEASFESLSLRHEEAEQKLAQAVERLEREQMLRAQIEEASGEELAAQTAQIQGFQEQAGKLQQQVQAAEVKLASSAKAHQQELTLRAQLEEANQQLVADLGRQASEHAKLESQLQDAVDSKAASSLLELKLKEQTQKLHGLQDAFDKEKTGRVELLERLELKNAQVDALEKQVGTATADEADIVKLLKELDKYKYAHAKNREFLESLSAKRAKTKMKAAEYRKAAEALRNELNAQRKISARLQESLDLEMGKPSLGVDQAEVDRFVQQAARAHVLSLKSQFEDRIKQKNQVIRELQNR